MSNKKLLSESQLRRFMLLSGQKNLTEPFLKKLKESCGMNHEDKLEEDAMSSKFVGDGSEIVMEDETEEKDELPPPEGGEEMPPPAEEAPAVEGGEAETIKALVNAIADAISQVSGVEVTVTGDGAEGEMGAEPPMGEEPPMEEPPVEGGELPPEEEEPVKEEQPTPLMEEQFGKEPTPSSDQNAKGKNKVDVWSGTKDQKLTPKELPKELNTSKADRGPQGDHVSAKGKAPQPGAKATPFSTPLSEALVNKVAQNVAKRLLAEIKKGK
jgi:hypothetical protein